MLYFSLNKQSKSEVRKQNSSSTTSNTCPANVRSQCVTPEPLVGRLETGAVSKLSFKLKDTAAKETSATDETAIKESKTACTCTRYCYILYYYMQLSLLCDFTAKKHRPLLVSTRCQVNK